MSYAVAIIAVIVAARYWFVSMDLREEKASLLKVNEILRGESQRNAEKANAYEHSNSLLARQIAILTPKRSKNGRFARKK